MSGGGKIGMSRAFIIFQVYQYLLFIGDIFYFKLEQFSRISYATLFKSGGTKDHFRQVKVPGTAPY